MSDTLNSVSAQVENLDPQILAEMESRSSLLAACATQNGGFVSPSVWIQADKDYLPVEDPSHRVAKIQVRTPEGCLLITRVDPNNPLYVDAGGYYVREAMDLATQRSLGLAQINPQTWLHNLNNGPFEFGLSGCQSYLLHPALNLFAYKTNGWIISDWHYAGTIQIITAIADDLCQIFPNVANTYLLCAQFANSVVSEDICLREGERSCVLHSGSTFSTLRNTEGSTVKAGLLLTENDGFSPTVKIEGSYDVAGVAKRIDVEFEWEENGIKYKMKWQDDGTYAYESDSEMRSGCEPTRLKYFYQISSIYSWVHRHLDSLMSS